MHVVRRIAVVGARSAFGAARRTVEALEWACDRADDVACAAARVEGALLGPDAPELRFTPGGFRDADAELARMTARLVEQGRN